MVIPRLLRLMAMLWLAAVVLVGLAVSIGSWLPSGTEFIFENTSNMGGHFPFSHIMLRDLNYGLDGRLTQSTRVGEFLSTGTWSPNGQQIAYFASDGRYSDVYIMDTLGHNQRRLTSNHFGFDGLLSWSPDSQYLLFSATIDDIPYSLVVNATIGQIYILPQLNRSAMWSPDSQMIVYQANTEDGTSHLYGLTINCLTHEQSCQFHELELLRTQVTYSNLAWSPDGQTLVFTQPDQGKTKIIVATFHCRELVDTCIENYRVVGIAIVWSMIVWSPDSQRLAFIGEDKLNIIRVSNGEIQSYAIPTITPIFLNWSPDGRYIAYSESFNNIELAVSLLDTFDGQNRQLIVGGKIASQLPDWRPTPH